MPSLDLGLRLGYKSGMQTSFSCGYASLCGGCDLISKPYDTQVSMKTEALRSAWLKALPEGPALPEVNWIKVAEGGLRDRVDLMIDQRSGSYKLGLFDSARTGLVDLENCPQLSPELEAWLSDFRKLQIPVQRGSVRLRVSPKGLRGVWLDLANVDVKMLLDERTTLDQLRSQAIVEIGQRRKRLVERDGQLKLADPQMEPWFETYTDQGVVPLYCAIGSFTQTGFRANRALVDEVRRLVRKTGARTAREFGSGIGNFTFPLASVCEKTRVFEVDGLALEGLRRSSHDGGFDERIEINEGNYQVARKTPVSFEGTDLVLVDPPRSGLQQFLTPLESLAQDQRPKHFIYISCFAESFALDAAKLVQMGFELRETSIVDQFPQSRHFEIVASFTRA